jgi:hypothetical protein
MRALQSSAGNRAVGQLLQRKLLVGGEAITPEAINAAGARKTRLNRMIAEAGVRHATPQQIRAQLTAMAEREDADFTFETMRHAIFAAAADPAAVAPLPAAEQELAEEMGGPLFHGFPRDQAWRLLMDAKHHVRGRYGFENEAGYMTAMMRGFTKILRERGRKVTAEYFEELHDVAVENVFNRSSERMAKGFRDSKLHGEGFGVDADTWSDEGFRELTDKYRHRNRQDAVYGEAGHPVGEVLAQEPGEMAGPEVLRKQVLLKPLVRSQCRRFANLVLDIYYQEIEKLGAAHDDTRDARLTAIVRCCQDLDQLHLFVDGNIRTIVFLLMNKLLMENDMEPAILHEPNVFDCKSVGELKNAVLAGQAKFASLKR